MSGLWDISEADVARAMVESPTVRAGVKSKAADMQEFWQSIAPVFDPVRGRRKAPPHGQPGEYRDSIHVEMLKSGAARVITTDYRAEWIEFGSAHMPEYAPATKTAEHFGGDGPKTMSSGRKKKRRR